MSQNTPSAPPAPTREAEILGEATRARVAAEEVLEKLTGTAEGDPEQDPLAELMDTLRELVRGQAVILRRLDTVERLLGARPPPGSAR
ncbi:MAG: hypothetical protein RQ966_16235 [Acetobacteraceae bacterium]|nr:hypothetical protein [Acetobacteraceae bacterium]